MTDTTQTTPVVDQADEAPQAEAPQPTFADFDVHPDIVASLEDAGIIHPLSLIHI